MAWSNHEIEKFGDPGKSMHFGFEAVPREGEIKYMTALELISCIALVQAQHLAFLQDHQIANREAISEDVPLDCTIGIGLHGQPGEFDRDLEMALVDYRVTGVHYDDSVNMLILTIADR